MTNGGSSYLALLDNTAVSVNNTVNWAVLAKKGGKGPAGDPGPAGISGYEVVTAGPFFPPGGTQGYGKAICPGTKLPVGGGVYSASGSNDASINSSWPIGSGWEAWFNQPVYGPGFLVYAVCANVS